MSLIFVSGAARSGKSTWAEARAVSLAQRYAGPLIYIATAQVYDAEMARRVELHKAARKDMGFETIERPADVGKLAPSLLPNCTVLLECLGTLLANEMFGTGGVPKLMPEDFYVRKIFEDVLLLNAGAANLLVVSNDIFSDGITYDGPTETYRRALGALHIKLAAAADMAVECAAETGVVHRGAR